MNEEYVAYVSNKGSPAITDKNVNVGFNVFEIRFIQSSKNPSIISFQILDYRK